MAREIEPYRLHYPNNSLHQQAYNDDAEAIGQWLLNAGDPDVRADNGQTLLHAAVHGGHLELVKLLIAHGADVNACSNESPYNTYPAQTAAYNGLLDILDTLVMHGADITVETENGCTLIHLAVFNNELAIIQYLLDREADTEIPAASGVTPLCSATMHSLSEAAELLLRAGADVNYIGKNGKSPLFYVGSREALEIMLAHGARLDIIDAKGNTLLHQAAEMILIGFDEEKDHVVHRALAEGMRIAELFVEQGMDINIRNHKGQTPLAVAVKEKNDEMANFLRQHGGIR